MLNLIKPPMLKAGDKVATVSLSWGGAGDEAIVWRYEQGKQRLVEVFGLEVVEMPHTLMGSEYVYEHPEKRAQDLMDAFKDPTIKGIVTCIGGIDSLRMLPYIDYEVIRENPKVFIGYSDTTTSHMICLKAGLSSFYGPTLLMDFAENIEMDPYTVDHLNRALFSPDDIGLIEPSDKWTSQRLPWVEENRHTRRTYEQNKGYEVLQGKGMATGYLLGGCIEVFDSLRGTDLFPSPEDFDHAILFFETSEDEPAPWYIECALRNYGVTGLLNRVQGIIWGKPQNETYYDDYKTTIRKVLKEFGLEDLPVLYNMNFGHTEPKITLPYGAKGTIDCDEVSFSIETSGVSQ